MKSHEYADLFPMMGTVEIARLSDDIRENGQADAIVTHEGKILDGRNRYQACLMADVEPSFTEYEGTTPLVFVVSHNLHRRHLNESQRGMVGAKLANMKSGTRTDLSAIAPRSISQKQAAELLNIGVDTIKRSKQTMRTGIPELQDMQSSGEISAKAASNVAKLSEEEQRKAVSGGVAGVKAAAKSVHPYPSPAPVTVDKTKSARVPKWIPDDAHRLWLLAKTDLDKILKNDTSREKTLKEIIEYAQNRINNNI